MDDRDHAVCNSVWIHIIRPPRDESKFQPTKTAADVKVAAVVVSNGKLKEAHFSFPGRLVLREWRARKKILRRHGRDSGLIVSVEVSGSRTGYAIFIIRRIGEPEDYVVQLCTDAGDVVKGESLIDDGIHADVPSSVGIRREVANILNRAKGRHRHLRQEHRKGRIRPQALGMEIQGVYTANVFPRRNGNGRRCVRKAGCDGIGSWYQVEPGRLLVLRMCSLGN